MRIAAIDIGTNSLHMIVVQVRPDLSFEVIDREKEMVRLGAGGLDGRALTPEAMHAALQVLSKFRRLAESHSVDEIIAVATSAMREAENGGEFLQAIAAADRHPSARHLRAPKRRGSSTWRRSTASSVAGDVAVVIDIGGGSVEITRGTGPAIELGRSFKLGVIRLTERFVKSDPLAPRDERKLVRHIDAEIGKYLRSDRARRLRSRHRHVGHDPEPRRRRVGGRRAARRRARCATGASRPSSSAACARSWSRSTSRSGCACPGSNRGAPTSPSPARSCSTTILRRLGADEITLCDLSLREGLVLDYIARHRKEIAQADRYPDVRRRSVFELAERCNYWPEHAQQVARLAIGAVRSDARHPRADRSRARVARIRGDPPRHRRAHQLRAATTSTRTT